MRTPDIRRVDRKQPPQEHTYVFTIICAQSHPQPSALITATSEVQARAAAIRNRIQNKICKICRSSLEFAYDGNPATIDGQPPEPRNRS